MVVAKCPTCSESVRLPSTELPPDASAECPWCGEIVSAQGWLRSLPPLLKVVGADGQPMDFSPPTSPPSSGGGASSLGAVPPGREGDEFAPPAQAGAGGPASRDAGENPFVFAESADGIGQASGDSVSGDSVILGAAGTDDDEGQDDEDEDSIVLDAMPLREVEPLLQGSDGDTVFLGSSSDIVNRESGFEVEELSESKSDEPWRAGMEPSIVDADASESEPSVDENDLGATVAIPQGVVSEDLLEEASQAGARMDLTEGSDANAEDGFVSTTAMESESVSGPPIHVAEASTMEVEKKPSSPDRRRVPLAKEQKSYYRRHRSPSRRSPIKQMLAYALGGVAAVPIAGGILLAIGRAPELGFWPFDGSFNRSDVANVRAADVGDGKVSETSRGLAEAFGNGRPPRGQTLVPKESAIAEAGADALQDADNVQAGKDQVDSASDVSSRTVQNPADSPDDQEAGAETLAGVAEPSPNTERDSDTGPYGEEITIDLDSLIDGVEDPRGNLPPAVEVVESGEAADARATGPGMVVAQNPPADPFLPERSDDSALSEKIVSAANAQSTNAQSTNDQGGDADNGADQSKVNDMLLVFPSAAPEPPPVAEAGTKAGSSGKNDSEAGATDPMFLPGENDPRIVSTAPGNDDVAVVPQESAEPTPIDPLFGNDVSVEMPEFPESQPRDSAPALAESTIPDSVVPEPAVPEPAGAPAKPTRIASLDRPVPGGIPDALIEPEPNLDPPSLSLDNIVPQRMTDSAGDNLIEAAKPAVEAPARATTGSDFRPSESIDSPKTPVPPAAEPDARTESPSEPEEVTVMCRLALNSLKKLDDVREKGLPDARSVAGCFVEVSHVGEFVGVRRSSSMKAVVAKLKQLPELEQFGALASGWLDYGKRQTDGIILVGRPGVSIKGQTIRLSDGKDVIVKLPGGRTLPSVEKVLAIGKIVTEDGVQKVELVAATTAP